MMQTVYSPRTASANPLTLVRRVSLDQALRLLNERSLLRAGGASALDGFGGLLEPLSRPRSEERCELCDQPIPVDHQHLVNLETRSLLCACRACCRLFTREGAAGGKFLAVPKRYAFLRDLAFTAEQWEALRIPVGLAFFLHRDDLGQLTALHPSAAGTLQSRLPLSAWTEMARANPRLATLQPDTEALLIHRQVAEHGISFSGYIVPIDACHNLLGRLRSRWKGFLGGDDAWREIDAFFFDVRARSCGPS